MKKLIFIAFALFCSCSTNAKIEELQEESIKALLVEELQDEKPRFGSYGPIGVVIVDENYNDRLNSESPSYWGNEYTNGINLYAMHKSERVLYRDIFSLQNSEEFGGSVPIFAIDEYYAKFSTITSYPVNITKDIQFYMIFCGEGESEFTEDEETIVYNWISYPDSSEDEIIVKMAGLEGLPSEWYIDKLWINGELAFQREYEDVIVESLSTSNEPFIYKQAYYNPKFYPWMKPVFTDKGEKMGVIAEGYCNVIVLVK